MNTLQEAASDQRLVIGCIADNCRLPFADSSFDCYISNLSMMIVPDYKLQVKEAYRVMKPDSYACFTVWGRPERSIQFTLLNLARKKLGLEPAPSRDNFHITTKIEEVKAEFLKAGFAQNLKTWSQAANWFYKDGAAFVQQFEENMPKDFVNDEIRATMASLYDAEGSDMRTFELTVILVHKM